MGRHILLVSSSKTRVPPQAHGAPLTFRPCSLSGPLSLSALLFSAVLFSSACKSRDTATGQRIRRGLLAGQSVPDPEPTWTCENCPGTVSKRGRIGFWGHTPTMCEKKKPQKARGVGGEQETGMQRLWSRLPGQRRSSVLHHPTDDQGRPSFRDLFRLGQRPSSRLKSPRGGMQLKDAAKSQPGDVRSDFCPCQRGCPSPRVHPCCHWVQPAATTPASSALEMKR